MTTGAVQPEPQGGDRRSDRIEALAEPILALVDQKADITLAEIAQHLACHHGQRFAPSVVHRPDVALRRRRWSELRATFDPARLVFIDETGASTKMARLYGRAPRGVARRSRTVIGRPPRSQARCGATA